MGATSDKRWVEPFTRRVFDLRSIRIEFAFRRCGQSSEFHSLRLLEAQGLLRTLRNRNQVAFDLRSHRKGQRDDFALDALVKPRGPLDRIEVDPFLFLRFHLRTEGLGFPACLSNSKSAQTLRRFLYLCQHRQTEMQAKSFRFRPRPYHHLYCCW